MQGLLIGSNLRCMCLQTRRHGVEGFIELPQFPGHVIGAEDMREITGANRTGSVAEGSKPALNGAVKKISGQEYGEQGNAKQETEAQPELRFQFMQDEANRDRNGDEQLIVGQSYRLEDEQALGTAQTGAAKAGLPIR